MPKGNSKFTATPPRTYRFSQVTARKSISGLAFEVYALNSNVRLLLRSSPLGKRVFTKRFATPNYRSRISNEIFALGAFKNYVDLFFPFFDNLPTAG